MSDVSEQIRIRSVYLAAIEEENWSAIGAPVYIRGFLRTYARFLGLDPEEVVAAFNGAPPQATRPAAESPATPDYTRAVAAAPQAPEPRRGGGSWLIWTAALIAVALIAFVVYNEVTMHRDTISSVNSAAGVASDASPSPDASATPAILLSPSPGGSEAPVETGPNSLALVLSAPSWLRVTVDGSVSMEGTFPAGTSKTFHGKTALVRVGNAGGVEIFVDGKSVGKLGKSGDVAEKTYTL